MKDIKKILKETIYNDYIYLGKYKNCEFYLPFISNEIGYPIESITGYPQYIIKKENNIELITDLELKYINIFEEPDYVTNRLHSKNIKEEECFRLHDNLREKLDKYSNKDKKTFNRLNEKYKENYIKILEIIKKY